MPGGSSRPRAALLLGLSYVILVVAWAFGNPPFAAPDEWSHQLRAIGVGRGHLLGPRAHWTIPADAPPLQVIQWTWVNQALRTVDVPAGLSPVGFDCNAFRVDESAACIRHVVVAPVEQNQVTVVGTYQPVPYLLPGLATDLADDPQSANRLARIASALPCLLLLLGAALVLAPARRRQTALVGLVVAMTPMVVFLFATLNGSGTEIAGGVAFAAALARLTRPWETNAAVWAFAGVSGALFALSRSTGPVWVVLLLLTFLVFGGLRSLRNAVRRNPRAALAATGAVIAGIAVNRWWEATYGPHATVSLRPWPESMHAAWSLFPQVLRQYIGIFGTIDSAMPNAAIAIWLLMALALVVFAAIRATWRERVVLLAAFVGFGLAVPILLHAAVLSHTGFGIQGRHVLPVVTAVPILAGELLLRRRVSARLLLPACAIIAAVLQIVGWYWNARRQAVGVDGPLWFIPSAEWSPPLGWWPWLALAVAGAAVLVAAGFEAARAERGRAAAG